MASLTVQGIVKRFGPVTALGGVDLHVADAEFCVLLGPSGCGKSTLLNIIAGLIFQDEGNVLFDDRPVDRLYPRERDVAMVFQNYALYPHMTVAQNLGFGLRMRRLHKSIIQERVTETARLLGIENLLDRKPRALSGGQRQRVAMGRALVRRPKLFLLDEPLSNLDARLRAQVRLELKQLHQQIKGTITYVTHDQVEAMTLGDKVVVMRNGRIHQTGPPEAIYERPADTFVATFIGSPEMNLFQGQMVHQDQRHLFEGDGFHLDLTPLNLEDGPTALGVRPEDIRLEPGADLELKARVEMLSNVGSEKYIHARLGQVRLTARAPKETGFFSGQGISLGLDFSRLHIFQNGLRVRTNPSAEFESIRSL